MDQPAVSLSNELMQLMNQSNKQWKEVIRRESRAGNEGSRRGKQESKSGWGQIK